MNVRLRGKQTLHLMKHDSLCFGGIVKNSEPPIMGEWQNWYMQRT